LVVTDDLLEGRCIDDVIKNSFVSLVHKTSRLHVAVRLFSNRSQKMSKCGKNISDTRLMAIVPPCLFLPYVVIICDLLLTKCTATWNLFVKQSYNYSLRQKRKGNYIVSYVLFTRSILDREEMKT